MRKDIAGHREVSRFGFTLIEACILLTIGGLMLSSALEVVKLNRARQVVDVNQERMTAIRGALAGFVGKYNRLPCAAARNLLSSDNNYGKAVDCTTAAIPPGTASVGGVRIGAVPVNELGLSREYMTDSWGNLFTYAVTEAAVNSALPATGPMPAAITVSDLFPPNLPLPAPQHTALPSPALYVLLSHGKGGEGAWNKEGAPLSLCGATPGYDIENCNDTATFNNAPYAARSGVAQHFDDIITASAIVNSITLPICAANETLRTTDGVNFTCIAFVTLPTPTAPCMPPNRLTYNGTSFVCSPTDPTLSTCAAGEYVTYNGTSFVCVAIPATPAPSMPPPCAANERLTSYDGINFSCLAVPPFPLVCPAGFTSTADGSGFTCQATAWPYIPACPAGYGLTGNGSSGFSCQAGPSAPAAQTVASCGVNQALTGNASNNFVCKTLNFAGVKEVIENIPPTGLGWGTRTSTCPAGTVLVGGSFNVGWMTIEGRKWGDNGSNGYTCSYNYATSTDGGDCRAICSIIQ